MTKNEVHKKRSVKSLIFKILKYGIGTFLLLILLLFGALQLSSVQTYLAQKGSVYLSQRSGYAISLDKIHVKWFDVAELKGVLIKDLNDTTLIYADGITIDYRFNSLLKKDTIVLDQVTLDRPSVNISWYPENVLNIIHFSKAFKKNKKSRKKPNIPPFKIRSGTVINGHFSYTDPRKPRMNTVGRFDHNYFDVDSIYATTSNFFLHKDTIAIQTSELKARESKIDFHIEQLATHFQYCKSSMQFVKTDVQTRLSHISDYVRFEYDNTSDFNHFVDSINIVAELDSTFIHTNELKLFAPPVKVFNDVWGVSGKFKGTVAKFRSKDCAISFGKNSRIKTSRLAITGLPNIYESNIRADLYRSKVTHYDLRQYFRNPKIANDFKNKAGTIYFDGFFHGFPTDFVSLGNFQTDLGKFKTDIQFKYKTGTEKTSKYRGLLSTEDFDLGRFIDAPKVGLINMNGKVEGEGFSKEDASVKVDGRITTLGFNNYTYQDIKVNGEIEKNEFDGKLAINDTNVKLNIIGDLDVNTERFNIGGKVDYLSLKPLGFSKNDIIIESEIDWNFKGLGIDTLSGVANFKKCTIKTDKDSLFLNSFNLSSFQNQNNKRKLEVHSSLFDFKAIGSFKFKNIFRDIAADLTEYEESLLKLPKTASNRSGKKYDIKFDGALHDIQPLLNIFYPEVSVSQNTNFKGYYVIDSNSTFQFKANDIQYVRYKKYEFFDNNIDIHSSLVPGTDNILAQHIVSSAKQAINKKEVTENLRAEVYWSNDSITFNSFIKQEGKNNHLNLLGNIVFKGDTAQLYLSNSDAQLLNKTWKFNNNNHIDFSNKNWTFNNLKLASGKESITLDGIYSATKEASLNLSTSNFKLKNVSQFTKVQFDGLLDGKTKINSKNGHIKTISSAKVTGFNMLKSVIGDFEGDFIYDSKNNLFSTGSYFIRDGIKLAKIHGYYNAKDTASPIDMVITTNDAPLVILEPFLFGHAKQIEGKGKGKVTVTGTIKDPNFQGYVDIKGGKTTISYLNTRYRFDGRAYFDDDYIYVNKLQLIDTLWNTKAIVDGGIYHKMFKKFKVDTKLMLDNTFSLNTQAKDNDLYYGQAFGTGLVHLKGPFNDFHITSEELTSNKGTKIYIPLEGTETVTSKSFISFESHDKPKEEKSKKIDSISLKGLVVDVNLNITQDAYMEIIFDKKAGDIIKGHGEGQINLNINTLGDFLMKGQYAIQRGIYNFTLVNLFDKRFNITPNSTITWNGDPYKGELDIKAEYTQLASLKPIADTLLYDLDRAEFKRKYPVNVELFLTGEILRPDVRFGMKVNETPTSIEDLVHGFHTTLANNEQELNKQVFSLIVLKQLAPEESLIGGVGAGSSVSELFSNQFSNWISQFDENLNIQIDLEGSDFRVQFDYSLLDGKLRITQNNNFTNENSTNSLANVFGEWTLEYILTNDGKLKLKGYNKTDQNSLSSSTGINNTTNTLYGVSLSYSTSFNKFSELFKKKLQNEAIKEDPIELDLEEKK